MRAYLSVFLSPKIDFQGAREPRVGRRVPPLFLWPRSPPEAAGAEPDLAQVAQHEEEEEEGGRGERRGRRERWSGGRGRRRVGEVLPFLTIFSTILIRKVHAMVLKSFSSAHSTNQSFNVFDAPGLQHD